MCSAYLGTVASNILKHKAILRVQENKMSEMGGPALAQLVESLLQKVAGSIPDEIIENFH
jgi:hypothetical protein